MLRYVRPVIKRIDTETILTALAPVNVLERSVADVSFLAAGPNPEWMTLTPRPGTRSCGASTNACASSATLSDRIAEKRRGGAGIVRHE